MSPIKSSDKCYPLVWHLVELFLFNLIFFYLFKKQFSKTGTIQLTSSNKDWHQENLFQCQQADHQPVCVKIFPIGSNRDSVGNNAAEVQTTFPNSSHLSLILDHPRPLLTGIQGGQSWLIKDGSLGIHYSVSGKSFSCLASVTLPSPGQIFLIYSQSRSLITLLRFMSHKWGQISSVTQWVTLTIPDTYSQIHTVDSFVGEWDCKTMKHRQLIMMWTSYRDAVNGNTLNKKEDEM